VSWPALSIGARKHGHGKDTPSKTPLDYLRQLIGERCERVDNPAGAILVLDIGPLGRWQERPDHGTIGWRQLTILSPWRLQSDIEVFCDWNADGGTEDGAILRAVRQLLGRTIVEAHCAPPGWDLLLRWSNGLTLHVFADTKEERADAWSLLGTDGLVLAAGPARRRASGWSARVVR